MGVAVTEFLKAEIDEMKRHKWIESEKAGRDLGSAAIKDWIKKYAAIFREKNCHLKDHCKGDVISK